MLLGFCDFSFSDFAFLGLAKLADKIEVFCSPANPLVSVVRESSFSPIICTFCLCFCGLLFLKASSFAESSQSVFPGFFELLLALCGDLLVVAIELGLAAGDFGFCFGASRDFGFLYSV